MTLDLLNEIGINEGDLSVYELSFAREVQAKKNKLDEQYEADQKTIARKYYKNKTVRSSAREEEFSELLAKYNEDVDELREELEFELRYFNVSNEASGEYSYPNNPDYSLSSADRYYVVYNYYMTMTDPSVRFALFQADELAADYLSNFYATLYDRLRSYVRSS
jgi:phenylalanyl-tRNA synthetase alpha subunit